MIKESNKFMVRVSLGQKIFFFFFSVLMTLILTSPDIINGLGEKLNDDRILGVKILGETVFALYCLLGGILCLVFFFQFWNLRKLNAKFFEVLNKLQVMEVENQEMSKNLRQVTRSHHATLQKNLEIEKLLTTDFQQLEHKAQKMLIEQESARHEIEVGLVKIAELSSRCKESEKETAIPIDGTGLDEIPTMEGVYSKFNQINENIFKIQLQTFHASVESYKTDENGASLSDIAKDIEELVVATSKTLEEVYVIFEEEQNQIRANSDKSTAFILEVSKSLMSIQEVFSALKEQDAHLRDEVQSLFREMNGKTAQVSVMINSLHQKIQADDGDLKKINGEEILQENDQSLPLTFLETELSSDYQSPVKFQ